MKSAYIKLPRDVYERILRDAKAIQKAEKSAELVHPADAYAHALGRCNGLAMNIVINLEVYAK